MLSISCSGIIERFGCGIQTDARFIMEYESLHSVLFHLFSFMNNVRALLSPSVYKIVSRQLLRTRRKLLVALMTRSEGPGALHL